MRYTVDWSPESLAALTKRWVQAPSADRQAITAAQATIDRLLATDPLGNGMHRSEGLYVIDSFPLHVLFELDQAAKVVKVVSVALLS